MHTFIDEKGRSWPLVITVGTARRVRQATGQDVIELATEHAQRLYNERVLLADILFALVSQEKPVSQDEFDEGLGGNALERALVALGEEVADFFRSGGQNPHESAKSRHLREMYLALPEIVNDALMEARKRMLTARRPSAAGAAGSPTPATSPGSAAATPVPGRSAS